MIRRWRFALPPLWIYVLAIVAVVFEEGFAQCLDWIAGMPLHAAIKGRLAVLVFLAIVFGLLRAVLVNPVFSRGYQEWLACTPWSPGRPLPFGPLHLTLWDAGLLAALELLAAIWGWPGLAIGPFFAAFGLVNGVAFLLTGAWPAAYGLAFAWGLVVSLAHWPALAIAGAVATYPLLLWGVRRSLHGFPWPRGRLLVALGSSFANRRQQASTDSIGWPLDQLAPCPSLSSSLSTAIPHRHGLLLSAAIGWWVFAIWSLQPVSRDDFHTGMILCWAAFAAAPARLLVYLTRAIWPISPWGRVRNGRWHVPGFDQVLVAPACALAIVLAGIALMLAWPPRIVGPVTVAAILAVCTCLGPSLRNWQLVGRNRLLAGALNAAKFIRPR